MINKEDKESIKLARKYGLRLSDATIKLEAFRLFERGYKASEVRYLLRGLEIEPGTRTFGNTIRRYYSDWKKAQTDK